MWRLLLYRKLPKPHFKFGNDRWFVSPWLENFVKSSLGHWERGEYFCYSCGAKMEIDDADGIMKCPKCGTTYNEHK